MKFLFLRKLKITTQLRLGFSMIIVCMLFVGVIDTLVSAQQQAIADRLVNHLYPAYITVNTIVPLMNGLDDDGAWYLLSHDPVQELELLQSFERKVQILNVTVKKAISLSDTLEQRQAMIEFQHFFFDPGAYYDSAHHAFALKRAGQTQLAYSSYTSSPFGAQIQQYSNIYTSSLQNEIARQTAQEKNAVILARVLDLGLVSLAALAGAVIATVVTRSIYGLYQELEQKNALQAETNIRLEALAATDPLTELPNHRTIVKHLTTEMERARRYQRPCSLLFLDLDYFKALNDGYGHAAGDVVLCEFATLVGTIIRGIDVVGRWGGEEFVVILPELGEDEAAEVAERIREVVSKYSFSVGGGLHLTCSIGLACYPDHAENEELLLNAADQAMYGAKHLGRNQVRAINDPALQTLFGKGAAEGGRDEIALLGTVEALSALLQKRAPSLALHLQQVSVLAGELAGAMGMTEAEVRIITLGCRLLDIGKVTVSDTVLRQADSQSEEELSYTRNHPIVGSEVVQHIPSLRPLVPIIRSHHERWDGKGYPDGLAGEHIPLAARIIAVADAYIALVRPDKSICPPAALQRIQQHAGTHFDPRVVITLAQLTAPQNQSTLIEA